jgi:2-oxoisovalerate dehydrogenase E2 component (dihydrolipoyl transacylase)
MSRHVFKLPDLGEGTVEAEIVNWLVKPGDVVSEDDPIVEVMTEKATVEVPAPVSGRVVSVTGSPGDRVAVGSELIAFETDVSAQSTAAPSTGRPVAGNGGAGASASSTAAAGSTATSERADEVATSGVAPDMAPHGKAAQVGRVPTSPAIRRRAREAGIDLRSVAGSGPSGRIMRKDLDAFLSAQKSAEPVLGKPPVEVHTRQIAAGGTEEIKVIGLRRLIAQRMSEAKRNIPHFSYVEEIDLTELEALRRHLNSKLAPQAPALTYLPFLVIAVTRVLEQFPQCNAHYDAERGVIIRHRAAHVGIATQTADGLKVPVVRNAHTRSLWDLATEIRRVTEAARNGKATRDDLTGSTITVTSLGKLGGIASTPIINAPEVSIIGVNRAVERPAVHNGNIVIRRMMNLSSSFDHRFVDGHDAAAMIQALKERLEHPATIFIES